MLRKVVTLTPLPCRAALRSYATHGTLPAVRRMPAAVFSAACIHGSTPRRWCSSHTLPIDATAKVAPESAKAAAPADLPAPEGNAESATAASTPSLGEQLRGLSPEDQQRIVAALQHPEKEKSSKMGGEGIGPTDGDMVAAFTCGPCNYRMVKRFSKHAYTKGIVIVECPNCRVRHLLADNLGWMEDQATNIEDILREKGESFTRIGGTSGDFQVIGSDAEGTTGVAAAASTSSDAQQG